MYCRRFSSIPGLYLLDASWNLETFNTWSAKLPLRITVLDQVN